MLFLANLLRTFHVIFFVLNVASIANTAAVQTHFGPMCDLSSDNVSLWLPSDINTRGGRPLLGPIAPHPSLVILAVGVQNYTCLHNGTYFSFGAIMELFDISCIPQSARASFTTFVSELWAAAPANTTGWDLVGASGVLLHSFALGQHYWVADPLAPASGALNPMWDFRSTSLPRVADPRTAYLVGYRTGIVPAPTDPARDAEWVTLAPLVVDGQPDGLLADQVFRLNTNGGMPPTNSCVPGSPEIHVKSTLNFWMYGGAWATPS